MNNPIEDLKQLLDIHVLMSQNVIVVPKEFESTPVIEELIEQITEVLGMTVISMEEFEG